MQGEPKKSVSFSCASQLKCRTMGVSAGRCSPLEQRFQEDATPLADIPLWTLDGHLLLWSSTNVVCCVPHTIQILSKLWEVQIKWGQFQPLPPTNLASGRSWNIVTKGGFSMCPSPIKSSLWSANTVGVYKREWHMLNTWEQEDIKTYKQKGRTLHWPCKFENCLVVASDPFTCHFSTLMRLSSRYVACTCWAWHFSYLQKL